MTNRYLTNSEIQSMADAACDAYEMTAERNAMIRAAREYAIEELGVSPRKSAVLLAVKLGQVQWQARVQATQRALAN